MVSAWLAVISIENSLQGADTVETVIAAFARTHDGWSSDEVLLDDRRRRSFLDECRRHQPNATELELCEALLRIRKQGGKLPTATKRDSRPVGDIEPVAEIAARRIQDDLNAHTDRLLVDPEVRRAFDNMCRGMLGEIDTYVLRKGAIRLRKTRRLEPELVSRVNDWKREIREYPLEHLQMEIKVIPSQPGIYLFRDKSGYLYIGQAQDLQLRLRKHLDQSDRLSLARYLANRNASPGVIIEVHVFGPGSPGEDLRMRKAYESELIRSRNPRFNLAP